MQNQVVIRNNVVAACREAKACLSDTLQQSGTTSVAVWGCSETGEVLMHLLAMSGISVGAVYDSFRRGEFGGHTIRDPYNDFDTTLPVIIASARLPEELPDVTGYLRSRGVPFFFTRSPRPQVNAVNEMAETKRILASLPPLNTPRVMIQIGASAGNEARAFVKDGWRVHAFDAAPMYKSAEDTVRAEGNPLFQFYNMAIALEERDSVTFFLSREHPGISSLTHFHHEHEPVEVPATTLRRFYREHGITAIDFMMLDAEMMDLEIMKTHDWSIPIAGLMLECFPANVQAIRDEITRLNPRYRHVVFEWRKPRPGAGILGVCQRMCAADDFAAAPRDGASFGNILFYESDSR